MARGRDEAWYLALFIWQSLEASCECCLNREHEALGGLYWPGRGWLTHGQISRGSGPICTEQVRLKRATGVCAFMWLYELVRGKTEGEWEGTGSIRFPWLACCWPQSYLDTLPFCFCLAVQSEHGGLLAHIYLCRATQGQVSAMQWAVWLCSAASVQHSRLHVDRQIEMHTHTRAYAN